MKKIRLDREDIKAKIYAGDTILGGYILAIDNQGSGQHKIYWADHNRAGNHWPDEWKTIPIPSLFHAGTGAERDLAEECLKEFGVSKEEIQRIGETEGVIGYAEEFYGDWLDEAKENMVEYLMEGFLKRCNEMGLGEFIWRQK